MKIGDGLKKIFQTVMESWHEDITKTTKMGENQDDEESWGLEGGYSLDRGVSRHSIDFHEGNLGEIIWMTVKENRKKSGKTLMGGITGVQHCLGDLQQGFAK